MSTKRTILSALLIALLVASCKNIDKKNKEEVISNPCDNPKTVKELLACANTVGTVNKDSIQVKLGSDLNKGCGLSWFPADTVLVISYTDSISLWRVNTKKNTPGSYKGHWFTNFSAQKAGLTKAETLNRFA